MVTGPPAPAPASRPAPKPAGGNNAKGNGEKKEWRRRDQEAPRPARPLKPPDDPALRRAVELFNGRVITGAEQGLDVPTQAG